MAEEKIKNLEKAAKRIKKAISDQENIIIVGDVDPDGVTSTIILKESIEALGGEVKRCYFPERSKEGYGLSQTALNFLDVYKPGLIILVDLGIGNYEEVELAKKQGFQTVIVDHHQVLKKPLAEVVVDPQQSGETYSFRDFSAGGLAYKLAQLLLKDQPQQAELERSFSELAMISTIADMMPLRRDNEGIVEEGLKNLPLTNRLALQILLKKYLPHFSHLKEVVREIIGVLNVSQVGDDHFAESFLLLTSKDKEEIDFFIKKLVERAQAYREERDRVVKEVEDKIAGEEISLVFEGGSNWRFPIAGSAASILVKRYKKPVFLFSQDSKISWGSVRAPKGIDSVKLMEKCQDLLINFGGHPPASGFRLKTKNLKKFKACLEENYS
jgi:single-stranded-DNA-specific exonuclease